MKPIGILTRIVLAQFACTSLWFAGNAVLPELVQGYALGQNALGHLTTAVQLGFIFGTLIFAIFAIADRFSPSKVFFFCSIAGALFNLLMAFGEHSLTSLFMLRFFTGTSLAGIYPVGMKIAADYFENGLGKSLGYLVGALVLGTAFPHFLKLGSLDMDIRQVVPITSAMAFLGGLSLYFLADGPFRKPSTLFSWKIIPSIFKSRPFRSAAFGYFGHMWELYAFWAFLPMLLQSFQTMHGSSTFSIPILSFTSIGIGSISCILGGYLSLIKGSQWVAKTSLLTSGICCISLPFFFYFASYTLFLAFVHVWGFAVIMDSPQFSTLVANSTAKEWKGTALTLVNCLGFAWTILSIQLLSFLTTSSFSPYWFMLLGLGPLVGLWSMRKRE